MQKIRIYNIDLIKGILILLVMAGHFIPGQLEKNLVRYEIYVFHMPLFIAVSGFLINRTALAGMSLKGLADKYVKRLMIPWFIAVITYTTLIRMDQFIGMEAFKILELYIHDLVKPFFHLWFVLGYLTYTLILWALLKMKWNLKTVFCISAVISILSVCELYDYGEGIISRAAELLHYNLRLYNLLFFVLGMLLREVFTKLKAKKQYIVLCLLISVGGLIYNIYLFYHLSLTGERVIYYVLNLPLVFLVLYGCCHNIFPRCRLLEYIGRNSFAFYLWHFTVKMVAKKIVGYDNMPVYYLGCIGLSILLAGGIYMCSRNDMINKYIFGAAPQKRKISE